MEYRIIYLPPFQAVTSGPSADFDFSEAGILGKFGRYFSTITPEPRDSFMPRDFLFFNREAGGLEWWWALADGMPDGGYAHTSFDGGNYITYIYKDGEQAENERQYNDVMDFLSKNDLFMSDERPGHYGMGHIITPAEIIKAQGYAVMEAFVPIKLR